MGLTRQDDAADGGPADAPADGPADGPADAPDDGWGAGSDDGRVDGRVEWFESPGGRIVGGLGLGGAALLLVLAVADGIEGRDLPAVAGFCFAAVLIWVVLFRPRVGLTTHALVLRRPLSQVSLPLAAIEQVALRQVLAVLVGEQRYVSTGLGRSRRALNRQARADGKPVRADHDYTEFVEQRLSQRMEDARAAAGVALLSDEQLALAAGVRRSWAWLEIAVLVGLAVLFVVGLLV